MKDYCGKSISASYYRGFESVGGKLFFDDTCITFKSHALNTQADEKRIEYKDIEKAKVKGFLTGMSVYTKVGVEHKFVIYHRKAVVEFLNSKVI
jgi:hypothetical protein